MDEFHFAFCVWFVLYQWLTKLQDLKERGKAICPLLVTDITRFAPHICECDIPKTRTLYIDLQPYCYLEKECLPRQQMKEETFEELHPSARFHYIPVHLFDDEKPEWLLKKQNPFFK